MVFEHGIRIIFANSLIESYDCFRMVSFKHGTWSWFWQKKLLSAGEGDANVAVDQTLYTPMMSSPDIKFPISLQPGLFHMPLTHMHDADDKQLDDASPITGHKRQVNLETNPD